MILHCPHCLEQFDIPLLDGIKWCDKCERMILSNRKNLLLSAFRILKKNHGKNMEKIRYDLKLSDEDFQIVSYGIEECFCFEDFSKYLNKTV